MKELSIDIKLTGLINKKLTATTNQSLRKETLNTEKIKMDFTINQVKAIAERVADSITYNIGAGLKYTGGKVAKNKPSTIRRKKQNHVLYETGILFNSVRYKQEGRGYKVYIAKPRTEIATYLQKGNKHMTARPFFGITKTKYQQIVRDVMTKRKGYVPEIIKKLRTGENADVN